MNEEASETSAGGAGIPVREAGGVLTIDLGALAANWRLLNERSGTAECAAVVKADGYGIGLEPAVTTLAAAGCRTFFVAHLSEAARARAADGAASVYVLNGLLPGSSPAYATLDLRPILGSHDEIDAWAAFCRTAGRALPAAVHVDTGMNRLGLRPEAAVALAGTEALGAFPIALLMSHLVSGEEPGNPINARQIAAFDAVRGRFPGVPASLCNSAGIFLPQTPHLDMVRPGYALYGGNPTPGQDNPMRPVVRLEGRVIQLRLAEAGETVGYNAQWTARGRRRIATISIGYGDGYPRAASSADDRPGGEAIVAGRRCPFAGRVSMDLITLDVTAVPEDEVKRGDAAVLIGDDLTVDEVGRRAGTIGYEVLTGLGRRYARRYVAP